MNWTNMLSRSRSFYCRIVLQLAGKSFGCSNWILFSTFTFCNWTRLVMMYRV